MRIVHIIPGLRIGGAETMLHKLLSLSDPRAVQAEVVSLTGIGIVGEKIQSLGIPVRGLGLAQTPRNLLGAWRLAALLRRDPPDVVQTWQYHADLLGGLAARLVTNTPVVWNVRHSDFDAATNERSMRFVLKACASLSRRVPAHIVCCSEVARQTHVVLGYPAERMTVIPNGFDLEHFRPDPAPRAAKRAELGVGEGEVLVGLVGRYHPQKDHATFFAAAGRLHAAHPEVRFLLCGARINWDNAEVVSMARAAGIADRCLLLGVRQDVAVLDATLDVACSSSFGEGFSNAIGEAMACGVPCVVTDVGDSARIVGDTGRVVPRRDPEALASALGELVALGARGRLLLGERARRRIEQEFDLSAIVERYGRLYDDMIRSPRGPVMPRETPDSPPSFPALGPDTRDRRERLT